MRLYTFINFYLSQIQQGIQTAHIVHELFNKYDAPIDEDGENKLAMLKEWSVFHKTIIVCNAGADQDIDLLYKTFQMGYEFPYAQFKEDDGLCRARTGCGIVLPDWIYDVQRKFKTDDDGRFKTPYYEYFKENQDGSVDHRTYEPLDKYYPLIDLIKSKRLA